jgi:hypothetical protein
LGIAASGCTQVSATKIRKKSSDEGGNGVSAKKPKLSLSVEEYDETAEEDQKWETPQLIKHYQAKWNAQINANVGFDSSGSTLNGTWPFPSITHQIPRALSLGRQPTLDDYMVEGASITFWYPSRYCPAAFQQFFGSYKPPCPECEQAGNNVKSDGTGRYLRRCVHEDHISYLCSDQYKCHTCKGEESFMHKISEVFNCLFF